MLGNNDYIYLFNLKINPLIIFQVASRMVPRTESNIHMCVWELFSFVEKRFRPGAPPVWPNVTEWLFIRRGTHLLYNPPFFKLERTSFLRSMGLKNSEFCFAQLAIGASQCSVSIVASTTVSTTLFNPYVPFQFPFFIFICIERKRILTCI